MGSLCRILFLRNRKQFLRSVYVYVVFWTFLIFGLAVFWIFLLIFCFSLLKYTYYYNYRSHISLQVAKLAKSAGVQILIFPTVCHTRKMIYTEFEMCYISSQIIKNSLVRPVVHKTQVNT